MGRGRSGYRHGRFEHLPGHFSGKVLPWLSLNIECEF